MKINALKIATTLLISVSVIGCSTLQPVKTQTLYLDDYSKLSKIDTKSGSKALVWTSTEFKSINYKNLNYNPIKYYNTVSSNENITRDVLNKVLDYTNNQVKKELSKSYQIVDSSSNADLIFKGVITKVDASTKNMQIYEALPIMLVYAGGKYLVGERELTTEIIFEGQFIDKKTNKPVIKYVQSIHGEQLENKKSQLTVESVKKALNEFAVDLSSVAK